MSLTYRNSGVDIAEGDAFVRALAPLARTTDRPGVCEGLGGFGALFDLKKTGFEDPLLVAGSDGTGTKLLLAGQAGQHSGIGIDLVAMCVNDILCHGAEPLFFLDYLATGKLATATALKIAEGIAEGCRQAGCALIGGETAEMPGLYAAGHYDLAGFALGAVERSALLPRKGQMQAGDLLIGLASSGLHANGFSLVRTIIERSGVALDDPAPFVSGLKLGEALLCPTRLYVRSVLPPCRDGRIKALAHITGGGLVSNLERILPEALGLRLDWEAIPAQPVFAWLAESGPVPEEAMRTVFNMGTGMVAVVAVPDADALISEWRALGETPFVLGELVSCQE